ncbi:hypothetical protein [Paramaledivibacter caminithermalis]|jgi:aconitase A|uniref:Uncharacterized protein n=1 Tax=Paramaledivibacter caminithermalis (strain DSM 15212 / CIP 107654 / DViRD3) TaxID=1121301 RepID=A0A1M6M6J7_PARC5|nr:hypothetical protein [Paramaledivibacter caminithermalis]SHJ78893.1 hypothetical protein SAMN02745912_01073 [Paramaledivibacter caminithermalis DSM 15212]
MDTASADLSEPYEGDNYKINVQKTVDDIQMERMIKDIKVLLNKYKDPKKHIYDYLRKVEKKMENKNIEVEYLVDKNKIKKYIEKHPYFKNPCNYHIRLLTIMKYLKKKGIDIRIKDIDLIVDEIVQEIDGVKKIGDGKYIRVLKG